MMKRSLPLSVTTDAADVNGADVPDALAAGACAAKGWGCRFWLAIKSPKGSEGVPKVEAETEGVAVMEGTWVCVPLSRSTISASSGSATLVG